MAKTKVITFEQQLDKMEEQHGIPVEDSLNVFGSFRKTFESMISDEADAKTKNFEFETPLGIYAFNIVDAEERVNSSDGSKFMAPEHYEVNFGIPNYVVDLANKNVDFSTIPSASEIAKSKVA
jgi:hypothetical protein